MIRSIFVLAIVSSLTVACSAAGSPTDGWSGRRLQRLRRPQPRRRRPGRTRHCGNIGTSSWRPGITAPAAASATTARTAEAEVS